MSDSARHAAYFVAESVYGTTPTNPAFKRIRHTGLTLGVQRGSLQSEELRPDRQIADFRLGTIAVAGDITTELSFAAFDDFLQAVLMGTWAAKATKTGTTLSAAASDDSFNDSGNGFVTAGFQVGDIITVSGFTGAVANNSTWLISSVAAGKLIVTNTDGTPAALIADDAAGESVTIATTATVLKAGTTRRSFSVLRHFTDIADEDEPYLLFNGVELNTLSLSVSPNGIIGATFGVLGREGVAPDDAAPSGSTFAEPATNEPMDAFSGALFSGVTELGEVTELSLTLENGLAVRNVVGSQFTIRPEVGRSNLTGSATVYFENSDFLKKFINETETALSLEIPDSDGNSYTFAIPRFKFTGGQPDVSGQGSVTLAMPFQALYDSTTASNIVITKTPAAP